LQDGKLIGAVTHVLVNDATVGYGIYVGNMLKRQRKEKEEILPYIHSAAVRSNR